MEPRREGSREAEVPRPRQDRTRRLSGARSIWALLVIVLAGTGWLLLDGFGGDLLGADESQAVDFSEDWAWSVALPADAPLDPRSDEIIDFLRRTNTRDGCVILAGAEHDRWGAPVYHADEGDPVFSVSSTRYVLPPEFDALRIPDGARPADSGDAEMVVYDVERGIVAHLSKAEYDPDTDTWAAGGGSVAYLDSNGLDSRLPESNEDRNTGSFRGYNGAVAVLRLAEVRSGSIDRMLKIGVVESSPEAVWPMVGSDGDSTDPIAPAQGTRIRIRPDVDLTDFDLHPQAAVIARALQTHGAMIADSTGGGVTVKLEDTVLRTGRQLWAIEQSALCSLPLTLFEVIAPGYQPPG